MSVHPNQIESDFENPRLNDPTNKKIKEEIDLSSSYTSCIIENETYEVEYYFSQALLALSIHILGFILGPFAFPFLRWIYGKFLTKNMLFRCYKKFVNRNVFAFIWMVYTIIMMNYKEDQRAKLENVLKVNIPVILLTTLLVSLKYGYYSKKHWHKLKTKEYTYQEIEDQQLIRVWLNIPTRIAKKELFLAFKRQNVNPYNMFIEFKRIDDGLRDFISADLKEEIEDNKIRLSSLSELLVKQVVEKAKPKNLIIVFLASGVYSVMPIGLMLYEQIELDIYDWVYVILSIPIAMIYCTIFLVYVAMGVYDFSRKKMMMRQCTALISKVDCNYVYLNGHLPQLELLDIQSVTAWYYMRNAFLCFGRKYTLRIFLYISLLFPLCLVSVVSIFLIMLGLIGKENLLYFIPGTYLILALIVILSYIVSTAVTLNQYFAIHRDILLSQLTNIRSLQARNKSERCASEESMSTILMIVEKLKTDETLHPVAVMGIKLDASLYTKLAAVAFSGLFALFKVLLT